MNPQPSKEKLIIYQVFPRILTNDNENCVANGTLEQNGSGKMNDFTPKLLKSIKDLGANWIWYTGIIEHATKSDFSRYGIEPDNPHVVKGEAGSPYAVKDYYDVDPALAVNPEERMKEFEALVARTHKIGLKVMIDFVPNHTARRYHSDAAPKEIADFGANDDVTMFFSPRNDYYYITNQQFSPEIDVHSGDNPYIEFPAKATGNDCFTAFCKETDWYETVKLNYGVDPWNGSQHFSPVPPVWLKMLRILRFWVAKGVDGFRCDMVFMVPLEFWHWAIPQVKKDYPQTIFIGEIYDLSLYRPFLDYGHFDYLYDKVNLYDILAGIETHGVSAAQLTGSWQAVEGIGPRMVNFLENHDEVRFGSKAYAGDPSLVVPSLIVSALISSGPFLLYYGQELGERATDNEGFAGDNNRTTIFDYWSYDTMRRWYNHGACNLQQLRPQEKWLRNFYKTILTLCNKRPEIREGAFFDLMYANLRNAAFNPHRQFAFIRYVEESALLIVANFDRKAVSLAINLPSHAFECGALPRGEIMLKDLHNRRTKRLVLDESNPLKVNVGASNAVILQISRNESVE